MNVTKLQQAYFALYERGKHFLIARSVNAQAKKHIEPNFKLSREQEQQAQLFWKPYAKTTTLYHRFYTEKTGVFSPYYLPTDIYLNVVDEYFNNRVASQVIDNKCYYQTMFAPADIAQPIAVAFRINSFWYNEKLQLISPEELQLLLNQQQAVFLKKATRSFGGKGVCYIDAEEGEMYRQIMDIAKYWREDIVIQQPLKQNKHLSAANESSVNTIRIISLLTDKEVKIYSAVLRMGVAGAKVDNASSGGITCGIAQDGRLKKYAYTPSGDRYEKHPTSGLIFENHLIPHFDKAMTLVKKAHPLVPHFRLVSWDIAIDEAGEAVMIEANLSKGALDFHQLNNGPLFGEDTKRILDEVFGRN